MKRLILLTLVLSTSLLGGEAEDALAGMKWLAGSWQSADGFFAYYSTPEGGSILSYSEMRRDGRVVFHEFERFHSVDGKVVYTPYPGGRPRVDFALASHEKDRAVFEHPKKDFPTRITFHRAAPDRLLITLSEIEGEKQQRFDLKRSP